MSRSLNVSLELRDIFEGPLDEPAYDELPPDPFQKFCETAEFHALGIDSANLERELAPTNARIIAHYKKLAASAEKPSQILESGLAKRMGKTASSFETRVEVKTVGGRRIEKTIYPSGGAVVAEFDENGHCVKTYIVEEP